MSSNPLADAVLGAKMVKTGDARIVPFPKRDHEADELHRQLARLVRNDMGNAERFIHRKGDEFIYVRNVGWYAWTGTHWSLSEGEARSIIAAQEVANAIHAEAEWLKEQGPRPEIGKRGESDYVPEETAKDFAERIGAHLRWWKTSGDMSRCRSMLEAARPHRTREIAQLDVRSDLFNVTNGTLELSADKIVLRPHDPSDLITRCAVVAYNPAATCPLWEGFLKDVQPQGAMREHFQISAGYGLMGYVGEQVVECNYGKGKNGKSTYMIILRHMVGNYGATLKFESLLHDQYRRGSEATPDLADLPGVRVVFASEPETGARFSESRLKEMTGGEPMKVRRLHNDFFEFMPQFKLWLSFNNRPTVRGQDEGIWRRLLLLPWSVIISAEKRDRFLADKIIKDELPGVLNWALAGAQKWLQEGFKVPDKVREATANYRLESDPLGRWLESATRDAPNHSETTRRLYEGYSNWCTSNGLQPVSPTLFGRIMGDRYERITSGIVTYKGIELLDDFADEAEEAKHRGHVSEPPPVHPDTEVHEDAPPEGGWNA